MKATIKWFNKSKQYGEAVTERDERVHVFLDSCTNYTPEPGDQVDLSARRVKGKMGFVEPFDLVATRTSFLFRRNSKR